MEYEDFRTIPNLHTHTCLCRHAQGTPDDYCREAKKYTRIIGISDHGPFPDNRYVHSSMFYEELDDYTGMIAQARRANPDMTILAGLEIEWCSDMGKVYYMQDLINDCKLDYLVGSAHYSGFDLARQHHFFNYKPNLQVMKGFVDVTLKLISCGVFTFIAHPDAMMATWDKVTSDHEKMFSDILDAAAETGVPLEFNASGLRSSRRYPCMKFWEMASERENLKVVVNSDAHKPYELYDEFTAQALETARALKLNICNEEIAQKIINGSEK
ncbi:MAG: hypothetical protein J6Q80_07450 [Lentisphaeria bacterium]|nr:hypothetical protein [Lentisphaeria bacterium]